MAVSRIVRISLTTQCPERLGTFYADAFGFSRTGTERRCAAWFGQLMGLDGVEAEATELRLGEEAVELLAFSRLGAPYPPEVAANDARFQHFAIVVSDMQAAYERLRACQGWSAISVGGPQQLPSRSGGVIAFKFRDPEGHPLELLQFPPNKAPPPWGRSPPAGPCLGIDHSAVTAACGAASIEFYRSLGFRIVAQTLNRGIEQDRLDGLQGGRVEVTALTAPGAAPPHLELLYYGPPADIGPVILASNDLAATRLVFAADTVALPAMSSADGSPISSVRMNDGRYGVQVHDPTGHALIIIGSSPPES